jgi:hypothetical protein
MTAENRPTDAVPENPDLTEEEQDVLDDAATGDVPNQFDGGFTGTEDEEPAAPTERLEHASARDTDWAGGSDDTGRDAGADDASGEEESGRTVADDGHAT